jgi:hypothetical protein
LLTVPLTRQLKKDHQFCWTPEAQSAFESLNQAFTTAPVLQMFDPIQPCIMETDASDFAIAGVLSQRSNDDLLHPIAFYCRKRKSAELNYDIYDKEMLAIVDCFKHGRQYLEGASLQTLVYTDHRNLEHFMSVKQLNRRQARWATTLASYNFVVQFRSGSRNTKADALSRRGDMAFDTNDPRTKQPIL